MIDLPNPAEGPRDLRVPALTQMYHWDQFDSRSQNRLDRKVLAAKGNERIYLSENYRRIIDQRSGVVDRINVTKMMSTSCWRRGYALCSAGKVCGKKTNCQ